MTLWEAIATGKRFRRPNVDTWITWRPRDNMVFVGEDLTAKDWVAEEPSTSVNRTTLLAACTGCGLTWGANNPKFLELCRLLNI